MGKRGLVAGLLGFAAVAIAVICVVHLGRPAEEPGPADNEGQPERPRRSFKQADSPELLTYHEEYCEKVALRGRKTGTPSVWATWDIDV